MTDGPSEKPRKKAGRKRSHNRSLSEKADVLLYAELHGDVPAAKRFGIGSDRTVRNYRAESKQNGELAALVLERKAALAERNLDELDEAYSSLLQRIIKLAPRAKIGEATQALQVIGDLKQSRDVWAEDNESPGPSPTAPGATRPHPRGEARAPAAPGATAAPGGVH